LAIKAFSLFDGLLVGPADQKANVKIDPDQAGQLTQFPQPLPPKLSRLLSGTCNEMAHQKLQDFQIQVVGEVELGTNQNEHSWIACLAFNALNYPQCSRPICPVQINHLSRNCGFEPDRHKSGLS